MRLFPALLFATMLGSSSAAIADVSTTPLHLINGYIESAGDCSERIVEWNRKYNQKAISGEVSRIFYYRVISFQEWGPCGRPYFKNIFNELQKIWGIYSTNQVTDAELAAKEAELLKLFFAALAAGNQGAEMVARYEQDTAWRLTQLIPDRQFFNCTYFGDQPKCAQ
jgi:hypothetical protein